MESILNKLNYWIQVLPKEYQTMPEEEISKRPFPNKWSKKEILGHLCDSAIHNLQRFITIQYEKPTYKITPYEQDEWVAIQAYQNKSLNDIIILFQALNKQIVSVIEMIPKEKLTIPCDIQNNQIQTLEWLIQDYVDHMEHHIYNQIFKK